MCASFAGDALFCHLGTRIQHQQKGAPLSGLKSKLQSKAVRLSGFVQTSPSLWMFCARLFPLTNQIIPLALGIQRFSMLRTYLSSFFGGLVWMTFFYSGFDFFISVERFNTAMTVEMGMFGLIAIAVAMRQLDKKIFQD